MNQGGGAPEASARPSLEQRIQAAKAEIARRLRYVRRHHPEGPFTLAGLAERAGVSKRTLSHAESADGSNLTLETLLKVSYSLGISRDAYFLDEQVFQQVNEELETLRVLRTQRVEGVALRTAAHGAPGAGHAPPVDRLSGLLQEILASAAKAQNELRDLPAPAGPPASNDDR
ncbi:helix-turn-helix domain-containing protein [Streptomyces sp. QH1-20]|uniref:helix-turn-helix domain-containing protein n=1 Tax=Streptomyces sp. QH1-20 TaxID=3240934 RepID=UPI0035189FDE